MKEDMTEIDIIKDKISNTAYIPATKMLLDYVGPDSQFVNPIVLIKNRYKNTKINSAKGILTTDEINIAYNKISNDLLNLVDLIKEDKKDILASENVSNNRKENPSLLPVVFEGNDISKSYKNPRGNLFELKPIQLSLRLGEITGVLGENGSGKSTLLKIIAGVSADSSKGLNLNYKFTKTKFDLKFSYLNRVYSDFRWFEIKKSISFIPEVFAKRGGKVLENLIFEGTKRGLFGKENLKLSNFYLDRLGLEEFKDNSCYTLSTGYKLRLELAIALMKQPKILVLDEPLAHLDIVSREQFLNDLKGISNNANPKFSVILSSHQIFDLEYFANQLIYLDKGKVLYKGASLMVNNGLGKKVFEFFTPSKLNLQQFYEKFEIIIKPVGNSYYALTSKKITFNEFTNILNNSGIKLLYIRDISKSVKSKMILNHLILNKA